MTAAATIPINTKAIRDMIEKVGPGTRGAGGNMRDQRAFYTNLGCFFTLRILSILVYPQCIQSVSCRLHVSYLYPTSKLQASETCCIPLFLQDTLRILVGYTQVLYPELLLGRNGRRS